MTHITKRATAGALITHDHEGGRAFAKAFANVRARSFFAHRVQVVLAQNPLDVIKTRARRCRFDANPFRFFQAFSRNHLDGDA